MGEYISLSPAVAPYLPNYLTCLLFECIVASGIHFEWTFLDIAAKYKPVSSLAQRMTKQEEKAKKSTALLKRVAWRCSHDQIENCSPLQEDYIFK